MEKNDDADEVLLILKDTAAKNVYLTGRSQAEAVVACKYLTSHILKRIFLVFI